MENDEETNCAYCLKHLDLVQGQRTAPPTPCTLSNGHPCPGCARRLTLRAQIEETKRLLDRLILEEQQARNEVNRHHDPIQQLPHEIISLIFRFTLPDFALQVRAESWEAGRAPSESGVLTLGAVCQSWRRIAWTTPQLWSNVLLTLVQEPSQNMIDVVDEWLERSRMLPLSIRLYLADNSGWSRSDGRLPVESKRTQHFVELFNKHSVRWQDLSVQCDYMLLDRFTSTRFLSKDGPPPVLKTLQLIPRSEKEPWNGFQREDPTHQLEDAIAMGYRQLTDVEFSWNNITTIMIDRLMIIDCIQLLLVAPRLVHLHLEKIGKGPEVPKPPIPLTHKHLQTLHMTSPNFLGSIFDSITLPALERLGLDGYWSYDFTRFPCANLLEFLMRSSCPLLSFSLEKSECTEHEIISVFDNLPPSIKDLKLDIRIPDAGNRDHDLSVLFGHIGRIPSSSRLDLDLFPLLETFKYYVFKNSELPWNLLASIPRPVSGTKRLFFKELSIMERHYYSRDPPPLFICHSQNINEKTIRDFIGLQEDGIDLYLPRKVAREDLLALLEDE